MERQLDSTLRPAPVGGGRTTPRRGVASVLAMMFLVIFGSLAAAMAVVAQGNLRTADSALKVSRAMSAAETGLAFASRRLASESRRFVVREGVIDWGYAEELWLGTIPAAEVTVLDPEGYPPPAVAPPGIMQAVRDAHLADAHDIIVEAGDADLPAVDEVLGILIARPIALATGAGTPYFRLRYELLFERPIVRVTSVGIDGAISRTLQMDFVLEKKIEFAVLSPNRIMIGKNVMVEGPLGSRFGVIPAELETTNGDPLVMRSDFYYLDAALDTTLDIFFTELVLSDVDGDGRLRPDHPTEGAGVAAHPELVDYDNDEYVDDFDLFLEHYDGNGDGRVCYNETLAFDAGYGALSAEFEDIDNQLARLIDEARPDRDGDGVLRGPSDIGLGYRDGVLDVNDLYGKVTGRLAFAVARAAWEAPVAHGESYQTVVGGPVRAGIDEAPVTFEVSDDVMREITTDMFLDSQTWFEAQVPNDPPETPVDFDAQVTAGGGFTPPADWESVPFGSNGAYDHYQRPIYDGITFENVRIPMGNNGLYRNCTFVGVTFIESRTDCDHVDWNYAGAVEPVDDGGGGTIYELRFPDLPPQADIDAGEIVADTRTVSNNLRFEDCTFLGSIAGDKLDEYTHWRNKIQMTGNSRFYIDPDDEDLLAQPDAAVLRAHLLGIDEADRAELAKSSLLLPGWSVDVGNFTNDQAADPADTPSVNLKGVIIAGILDVRGTATVAGTLLMTFRPTEGLGPLFYGGQPDAFNTTLGYFGPLDGDNEGIDPSDPAFNGFGEIYVRYDPNALLPDGIPWPVRIEPLPFTYFEGAQ